jgi:hypothetical protein
MRYAAVFLLFFLFPAASFALPPLDEKIEKETGVVLTLSQKEELASMSQKKYAALKDAHHILVMQLSQILALPEKSIREELFSETGVPQAELNPMTGAKLEKILGREMTKTEYDLVDMAFKAWKEREGAVYREYAGAVANLVDLPQDAVLNIVTR